MKNFKVPVIIHNSKNYDSHFIIQKIGDIINKSDYKNKLDVIANNSEKFITISWNNLKIIDSFQFMNNSLNNLANNLNNNQKVHI